jgi:hypothetical protein
MASRYMKKCPISTVVRETQIKTTLRHNLTSTGRTVIKIRTVSVSEELEEREPWHAIGENVS